MRLVLGLRRGGSVDPIREPAHGDERDDRRPGADAIWLNADDHISEYDETEFSAAGGIETATPCVGPGPDGEGFTADDQRSNQVVHLPFPDERWVDNFGIAL